MKATQWFLILLIFFSPLFTVASIPGATSTALAGSGRSAVDTNESFLLNPASLAHFDGASFTFGTYFYRIPSHTYDSKALRFSIAENSPLNDVALAMSYGTSADLNSQQNDFWLSAGDFVSPFVSVGFTYHYSEWRVQTTKDSPLNLTPLPMSFENNASLGILVTPNSIFGLSFVAQDFIPQNNKTLIAQRGTGSSSVVKEPINSPQLGIGAVYLSNSFLRFHADLMTDESAVYTHFSQFSLGIENMISEWILTRWGLASANFAYPDSSEGNLSQKSLAFGIGFIGPRFEVYLATKQNAGFQNSREHSVDFHIPF